MSFAAVKSDTGAVLPWEYLPAKAGTYQCGQMVGVSGGFVSALSGASSTTPPYLCVSERTIAQDGDLLPVVRVARGNIFETTLSAGGNVQVGSKLGVAAGGLEAGGSGTFEVTWVDSTAQGDPVRGRFV